MFPFERNHYYYGKLLSVEDFNLEQNYNSSKQRMNHMFLSGAGIVSGMNVVEIGDQTISVETGCALDAFGREMVIHEPITKKLQLIDGFERATAKGENYIYLCVEYDEKAADSIYNIAGSTGMAKDAKENTYNKVVETCRLFCTNQEPELNGIENEGLFQDTRQLFSYQGITIRQSLPRYVEAGKKAIMKINIETDEKHFLAFSFKMNLNGLVYENENSITVNFDELLVEKSGSYSLTFELDPVGVPGYRASAAMEQESFRVIVNQKQRNCNSSFKYQIEITNGDIKEKIIESYYTCSMNSMMEKARQKYIYLAKIYVINANEVYQIQKIINAPMKQYVMSQTLLGSLNKVMMQDIRSLESQIKEYENHLLGQDDKLKKTGDIQIAQGVCDIDLGLRGENHKKFFSAPISHGLGLGYVTIMLSQETRQDEIVFGNAEVFDINYTNATLAAKLDETTGSFVIGVRLNETVAKNSIRVHWTAIRKPEEQVQQSLERRMSIKPSMLELYTRESACLEVAFYNMEDKQITWQVKEGGGSVDETNVYTAPNEKGVYEIVAKSVAYKDVRASIFAVVREH